MDYLFLSVFQTNINIAVITALYKFINPPPFFVLVSAQLLDLRHSSNYSYTKVYYNLIFTKNFNKSSNCFSLLSDVILSSMILKKNNY